MKFKPIITAILLITLFGCSTGSFSLPIEQGKASVVFCDKTDCFDEFKGLTQGATSLNCAIYSSSDRFLDLLEQKNANLVVDGDHKSPGAIIETGSGLMHNKFCVINNSIVWTGSWNPSQEMTIANNVLIIKSSTITNSFLEEFNELSSGVFHKGKSSPGRVILSGNEVESYFCPEDNCKEELMNELREAKNNISFMTFSFTDDDIGDLLLEKANQGVKIGGIFDPRKNKYSEYEKLKDFSIISKVHHKVFIIDDKVVTTGSYNPTQNGNTRNDENMVILHNKNLTLQFEKEFQSILSTTSKK